MATPKRQFVFISEFGETLDLASYLFNTQGESVDFYIKEKDYGHIGEGIVPRITDWFNHIGRQDENVVWVFDSTNFGEMQDWLRSKGEKVFGGSADGDKLENDRHLGQKWFKQCGFKQVQNRNFTDISQATHFVETNADRRWILKQNGDAPKSISYMGKFEDCSDLIYHLNELKRSWNEVEFGHFDCDLMEVVEGTEIGATAFFDGSQFLTNKKDKVVGYLDFEEKKEADDGLGETTGEMGTVFVGVDSDNRLFSDIMLRPGISEKLKEIGFRGVFNINCILTDKNEIVALEPTMRFGVPATSYEFIEGLQCSAADLIEAVASGSGRSFSAEVFRGIGLVMCIVAKPYPLEVDVEPGATSVGQRLWILGAEGLPRRDFTDTQREHIHLYNFIQEQTGDDSNKIYRVATKNGFLLTTTGKGMQLKAVRKHLVEYIRSNIFINGMKWRSDIGKRVEEFIETL